MDNYENEQIGYGGSLGSSFVSQLIKQNSHYSMSFSVNVSDHNGEIGVVGELPELGAWDVSRCVKLI
jgi:hypothetical protein